MFGARFDLAFESITNGSMWKPDPNRAQQLVSEAASKSASLASAAKSEL